MPGANLLFNCKLPLQPISPFSLIHSSVRPTANEAYDLISIPHADLTRVAHFLWVGWIWTILEVKVSVALIQGPGAVLEYITPRKEGKKEGRKEEGKARPRLSVSPEEQGEQTTEGEATRRTPEQATSHDLCCSVSGGAWHRHHHPTAPRLQRQMGSVCSQH
jgi:hypothetical protein